jgi:hypothetical protein
MLAWAFEQARALGEIGVGVTGNIGDAANIDVT